MRQCLSPPEPRHTPKVVDYSLDVNSQSHNGAFNVHGSVNSSRIAKSGSTAGAMALPEAAPGWFAVTRPDGSMAMIPPPPALPQQIIPAHWHCPWIDAAKPINPEGYLQ